MKEKCIIFRPFYFLRGKNAMKDYIINSFSLILAFWTTCRVTLHIESQSIRKYNTMQCRFASQLALPRKKWIYFISGYTTCGLLSTLSVCKGCIRCNLNLWMDFWITLMEKGGGIKDLHSSM